MEVYRHSGKMPLIGIPLTVLFGAADGGRSGLRLQLHHRQRPDHLHQHDVYAGLRLLHRHGRGQRGPAGQNSQSRAGRRVWAGIRAGRPVLRLGCRSLGTVRIRSCRFSAGGAQGIHRLVLRERDLDHQQSRPAQRIGQRPLPGRPSGSSSPRSSSALPRFWRTRAWPDVLSAKAATNGPKKRPARRCSSSTLKFSAACPRAT